MEFGQRNILAEIDLVKSKIDDVLTTHIWYGEDMYNKKELTTKEEKMIYAYGYEENRKQHEQTTDLLTIYLEQLDKLLVKFKRLDIKRDRTHDEIGNGQHNVEQ